MTLKILMSDKTKKYATYPIESTSLVLLSILTFLLSPSLLVVLMTYLGAVPKFQKSDSWLRHVCMYVLSVRPSVRPSVSVPTEQLGSHWTYFCEI